MHVVNNAGVSFIKAKLQQLHKRGDQIAHNPRHMQAWVASVENHANESTGPYFEVSVFDSLTGQTEVVDMPPGTMSVIDIPEPDRLSQDVIDSYPDEAPIGAPYHGD